MTHEFRCVAEPVVRLPVIVTTPQQQRVRFRVAIHRNQVAGREQRSAERIHLSRREPLHAATVQPGSIDVAAVERDRTTVERFDDRRVCVPMVDVQPPVVPATESVLQSVCVFRTSQRVKHFAPVGPAIAVGVLQVIDVRDAIDDHAAAVRIQADRDIQIVSERGDLVCLPIAVGVFEDLDRVASPLSLGGVGVFDRAAHPESTFGVEGQVQRFLNVRFGGDKLDIKSRRQVKRRLLVRRRQRFRGPYLCLERVVRSGSGGQQPGKQNRAEGQQPNVLRNLIEAWSIVSV